MKDIYVYIEYRGEIFDMEMLHVDDMHNTEIEVLGGVTIPWKEKPCMKITKWKGM